MRELAPEASISSLEEELLAKPAELEPRTTNWLMEIRAIMARKRMTARLQVWIEARKRHHLSHAHIQMARELGMNPTKLGKLDNHKQEPWKLPLPQFIEHLYEKSFGKTRPDIVLSIEEVALRQEKKKAVKREARRLRAGAESGS